METRKKLYKLFKKNKTFRVEIIECSEELDKLIYEYTLILNKTKYLKGYPPGDILFFNYYHRQVCLIIHSEEQRYNLPFLRFLLIPVKY